MRRTLLVAFSLDEAARGVAIEALGGAAELVCLADLAPPQRGAALSAATVVLVRDLKPFSADEFALLGNVRLVQCITAGVDYLPLSQLPANVPVAANGGGYAEPMAEHALAMVLAAVKRIVLEHAALARGEFRQHIENRMLAGSVCGIFGFGSIGIATARIMRNMGLRVHGINRSGTGHPLLEWIGTPDQLDMLLAAADVMVISAPLTRSTTRLFGARELALMKSDAILVNLARGEIIDEAALFAHLQATPTFTACIDAWWIEPIRHGAFHMDHPFMSLPNVIASPHNSATVPGSRPAALRRAIENCKRALVGEPVQYVVSDEHRMR
ncbi:MAG: hydroxyacid dehydrogenase [Betaproteobacteria bacterium]|nr:hydroxyacid dehydrogenase [Betaproteobacteria bacterium]